MTDVDFKEHGYWNASISVSFAVGLFNMWVFTSAIMERETSRNLSQVMLRNGF